MGFGIWDGSPLILAAMGGLISILVGVWRSKQYAEDSIVLSIFVDIFLVGILVYGLPMTNLYQDGYNLTGGAVSGLLHAILMYVSLGIGGVIAGSFTGLIAIVLFFVFSYITSSRLSISASHYVIGGIFLIALFMGAIFYQVTGIPHPATFYLQITPFTTTGKSGSALLGMLLITSLYFGVGVARLAYRGFNIDTFLRTKSIPKTNFILAFCTIFFISPIIGMLSGIAVYRLGSDRQIGFVVLLFLTMSLLLLEYRQPKAKPEQRKTTATRTDIEEKNSVERRDPKPETETIQRSPRTAEDINTRRPDDENS